MAPLVPFLIASISFTILFTSEAQDRAPHGLFNENPVAFSPSTYGFFHPNNKGPPCAYGSLSSCSTLSVASQVASAQAQENQVSATRKGLSRLGAGGAVDILFGLAFAVALVL